MYTFFFYDNDDDYYYDGYSLEFSCLTYNFLLFLVFTHLLYINLGTAVRSPEDMFFKVDSRCGQRHNFSQVHGEAAPTFIRALMPLL